MNSIGEKELLYYITIQRIAADPNGRFVKIRIRNRNDDNTMTISSVYLEPNRDTEDINKIIFESNIIGGDMNNANSGLNQHNVFHYKNIEIEDIIKLENNTMFEHPILIGKNNFYTHQVGEDTTITIIDKRKTEINYKILYDIIKGK